jgi:hypothetical protein
MATHHGRAHALLGTRQFGQFVGPDPGGRHRRGTDLGIAGADAVLVDGECNQTDSTVTCCLKQNPGQYEKCGATAPTQQQPSPTETQTPPTETQPRRPPPLIKVSSDDDAMTDEEVDKMCRDYYVRCIERRGLKINLQYGTSHCQSCFDLCRKKRYWPWSANGKRCPGG